ERAGGGAGAGLLDRRGVEVDAGDGSARALGEAHHNAAGAARDVEQPRARAETQQRDEAVKIRGGEPSRLPEVAPLPPRAVRLAADVGVELVAEAAVSGVVEGD